MSNKAVAAILIAAVVIVGGCVAFLCVGINEDPEPKPVDPEQYRITYVLNGGTADPSSPSAYRAGEVTDLGCPTKMMDSEKEYLFMGWYLDAECTESILYIPSDMTGDITLYASWDTDVVGHGFQFDTKTTTTQDWFGQKYSTRSYGKFSYTYLHYSDDDGYLLKRVTGTMLSDGSYYYTESVDWQSSEGEVEDADFESDVVIEIGEWKPVTEKVTIYMNNNTYKEEQYYLYGWLLVKLDTTYQTRSVAKITEYSLTDLLSYEAQPTYTVNAYSDRGLTVSGTGEVPSYSRDVVLSVTESDGYQFAGWYDEDGNLLSTNHTYTVDLVLSNITVYAMNDVDSDYIAKAKAQFAIEPEVPMSDVEWILHDDSGIEVARTVSDTFVYTFDECGSYELYYTGTDGEGNAVSKLGSIVVDDTVTKVYSWSYNGKSYTAKLDIQYLDYFEYRNDPITRSQSTTSHDLQFVTYEDKYIVSLASQIKKQTASASAEDRIMVALRFAQTIPYVTDADSRGTTEFYKFPLETLYDNGGDCEDTTFLFCAIGKALGYDVAIMYFEGHAAAGINMTEVGYGTENIGTERIRSSIFLYEYYVLKVDGSTQTYLYPEDSSRYQPLSKFYLYCETTTVEDGLGNNYDIGDVPNYSTTYATENPYSSLNVQKVMPVVDTV